MAMLKGLILAATLNDEDDLVHRLRGRSRYAMPLANRALVRYGAEALVAAGVTEVAVAVSSGTAEDVRSLLGDGPAFGIRFAYIELSESATVVEALSAARERLGDHPIVVHSGDAVVSTGLQGPIADFNEARPDVLLLSAASHWNPQPALVGVRGPVQGSGRFAELEHVAPAAIVSAEALRGLEGFEAETSTLGGTVAALAESGVSVAGRSLEGCWCYAGDFDHLLEGNRMILDELPHTPIETDYSSVRIEGRVAIHPDAKLERVTIRGPATIAGGTEVMDTFIGPYTSIGSGACLEGAEIDHSIVLEGARISHLGHRLEASVIGAGAQISRDFGMPSSVRLNVGRGSEVNLA
jgi:glucose-1-phosphate thymidylyltransferase